TYLTHDSPSVRKTHCSGRKHKENVKDYYQKWMEEQAQSLIDKTSKANLSVTPWNFSPSLPPIPCSLSPPQPFPIAIPAQHVPVERCGSRHVVDFIFFPLPPSLPPCPGV
uniref:Matrin-type domain-containing protein n=1 Tax=Ficedula albicollis TaxID=59894 RepID=A0A803WGV7_FICAL